MKVTASTLARAFVDIAQTLPAAEVPALADATAAFLVFHGLSRHAPLFPRLVEREWLKREGAVSAKMITTSGRAGKFREEVLTLVQDALRRPCHLEEIADPSVLGGVLLTVGDECFDATLRGALTDLAQKLAAPVPVS
jgi:hypothetical protein